MSEGMFSNERVIILQIKGSGSIEEFVPADDVQGEGHEGRVRVHVVDREDGPWAVLPTSYRKTVPVDEGQFAPA
ncbi:MAG: hypothetical protein V3V96_14720 [Acidiferrobacterales bacterium]